MSHWKVFVRTGKCVIRCVRRVADAIVETDDLCVQSFQEDGDGCVSDLVD